MTTVACGDFCTHAQRSSNNTRCTGRSLRADRGAVNAQGPAHSRTCADSSRRSAVLDALADAFFLRGGTASDRRFFFARDLDPRAVEAALDDLAREAAMFVLEGEGMLRIGDDTVPIRAGDYATFPVGPRFAHQVQNTGAAPLRYLAMSTLHSTEVVGYPDSKKLGARSAPSYQEALKGTNWVGLLVREGPMTGYYEGEDLG
jgi:hypothetical protein